MPGDGVRAIEQVTTASPATRTLVLTMHDDPAYVQAAMTAGASGYVLKGAASEELIAAIRTVAGGRSYVQVSVGQGGLRGIARVRSDPPLSTLSHREREVLRLVAHGLTSREIGEKLRLKTKTIDTYRTRIHDKLGVDGRAGLVAYALRSGILVGRPER
jgi:DNA-binding NarL/FixJ family response regulator